jgi:outer membrane protein insertion porin family
VVRGVWKKAVLLSLFHLFTFSPLFAQDKIINPDISYAGTPRNLELGGLAVKGVEGYEDYVLTNLSGLTVGQRIDLPGVEITEAVFNAEDNHYTVTIPASALATVGNDICVRINVGNDGYFIETSFKVVEA